MFVPHSLPFGSDETSVSVSQMVSSLGGETSTKIRNWVCELCCYGNRHAFEPSPPVTSSLVKPLAPMAAFEPGSSKNTAAHRVTFSDTGSVFLCGCCVFIIGNITVQHMLIQINIFCVRKAGFSLSHKKCEK